MTKVWYQLGSHNWRIYEVDDSTPVANENTKGGVDYNEALVIHLCILESGGVDGLNRTYTLQYSFNQSDWFSPGGQGGTSIVNYDNNPNLTEHAASSQKIAGCSTSVEKVHEDTCNDLDISASIHNEVSLCIELNDTVGERDIYFRAVDNGTPIPLEDGSSYPVITSGEAPEPEFIETKSIERGIERGMFN